MSTSFSANPSLEEEYKTLTHEGKVLAAQGKLKECLKKFEAAKLLCPSAKVLQRIEKIKEVMKAKGIPLPSNENSSSSDVNHLILPNKEPTSKVLGDIKNVEVIKAPEIGNMSPESEIKFKEYKKIAKDLSHEGRFEEAITCFKRALKLFDCPRVKRYIQELEKAIALNDEKEASVSERKSLSPKESQGLTSEDAVVPSAGSPKESETDLMRPSLNKSEKAIAANLPRTSSEQLSQKSSEGSIDSGKNMIASQDDKLEQVRKIYSEARDLARDGKLKQALELLNKAQNIQFTNKVQKQIDKLEELLSNPDESEESDTMVKIAEDFFIFHDIFNKLYPYQKEGVAWMWKLYSIRKGGVLGDDMGLGKTFQVIAFLSGMIDSDRVKHILIIMPVSLISTWENEFKKWCPGISVHPFHGGSKKERERNLLKVQKRGHVLLTSYGMLVGNLDALVHCEDSRFIWDYVILDEGHKIKNPTKTTKAVHEISARNRLVLTGTPIQNNLRELWSLYDFAHHGTLLGSQKTFKMMYENPITTAREKDATLGEKVLGTKIAENLKTLIKPYFLRRTKDEIWGKKSDDMESLENKLGQLRLTVRKNDLIVWCFMNDPQIEIYKSFLHSEAVKSILMSRRSPLVELTVLKKICDHPRLLSKRACLQLGLHGNLSDEELLAEIENEDNMASSIDDVSDETLLMESGKLKVVIDLLEHLRTSGHRTLVFSLSRKILDMIQRILANKKWRVMRLDGTITKREERENRIQTFQTDARYSVFLLTTQVGGVGITLTSADRVIIYDPSWNPATDAQAVDRVYRIGQQKNVVVYRMITCGTVEEKIYRRQIFKDSITRQTTTSAGSSDPYRYFSKQELRELFTLDDPYTSKTQVQLSGLHSDQRNTDDDLENHILFLKSLNIYGISDHDLMFSREIKDPTEDTNEDGVCHDYIQKQLDTAQELIAKETSVAAGSLEASGAFYRPYQETVPTSKKTSIKDYYKPPVIPEVVDLTDVTDEVFKKPPDTPEVQIVGTRLTNLNKTTESITIGSFSGSPKSSRRVSSLTRRKKVSTGKPDPPLNLSKNESLSGVKESPDVKHTSIAEKNFSNTSEFRPFSSFSYGIKPDPTLEHDLPLSEKLEASKTEMNAAAVTSVQDATITEMEKLRGANESIFPNALTTDKSLLIEKDVLYDLELDYSSPVRLKSGRKSCARRQILPSDSESSHQGSCPSSPKNSSSHLVQDSSASSDSSEDDSSSGDYVADSVPSTPQLPKESKRAENPSLTSTPVKSGNMSASSQQNVSARRITPIRVGSRRSQLDLPFAKALASSPLLDSKPVAPEAAAHTSASTPACSESLREESPLKFVARRKKVIQIASDSEEEEDGCAGLPPGVLRTQISGEESANNISGRRNVASFSSELGVSVGDGTYDHSKTLFSEQGESEYDEESDLEESGSSGDGDSSDSEYQEE